VNKSDFEKLKDINVFYGAFFAPQDYFFSLPKK
jgi:hypothetical protein